ncbi:MAG: lysostaphin resistance A-like protein [Candidatus Thorarchaeota archaeon]
MAKRMSRSTNESKHTAFSYWIGIIAIIVEFILGIRYVNSPDPFEQTFATVTLIESFLGFIGWISLDPLYGVRREKFYKPDKFKPLVAGTLFLGFGMLIILALEQTILLRVPLTIRNIEIAGAIIFAGPCEELFFRGLLVGSSDKLGRNFEGIPVKIKTSSYNVDKELNPVVLLGIFISTIMFTLLHQNYAENRIYILVTFISGLILAIFFWIFEDITANIIAHVTLNIIAVYQTFYMVQLFS